MSSYGNQWFASAGADAPVFYDHQIEHSIRIDPADSSHLKLDASDASNNRRYWTLSTWVKKTGIDDELKIHI